MARGRGNAEDYTYGEALRDAEDLKAQVEPEYLVEATTYMTEAELSRSRERLEKQAARKGMVVGVKPDGKGFRVTVEKPNPAYKGRKTRR